VNAQVLSAVVDVGTIGAYAAGFAVVIGSIAGAIVSILNFFASRQDKRDARIEAAAAKLEADVRSKANIQAVFQAAAAQDQLNAESAKEVKAAVVAVSEKTDIIAVKSDQIHVLVDGTRTPALETIARLARLLADRSGKKDEIKAADQYEKDLSDHTGKINAANEMSKKEVSP
jgi:hypothetical protein